MRKLLIGLLALGSVSSFAQTQVFENATYPEQKMEVTCLDDECEVSKIIFINGKTQHEGFIKKNTVLKTIKNRRKIKKAKGFLDYDSYELTSEAAQNMSARYKEAYYGKAAGNFLLTIGAAILETNIEGVLLPVRLIDVLARNSKRDSLADKKGAKTYINNAGSDLDKVIIKHKYYERTADYLQSIAELNQDSNSHLEDFISNFYSNCYVLPNVNGWANQIYVNEQFLGNYDANAEEVKLLEKRLQLIVDSGVCKPSKL